MVQAAVLGGAADSVIVDTLYSDDERDPPQRQAELDARAELLANEHQPEMAQMTTSPPEAAPEEMEASQLQEAPVAPPGQAELPPQHMGPVMMVVGLPEPETQTGVAAGMTGFCERCGRLSQDENCRAAKCRIIHCCMAPLGQEKKGSTCCGGAQRWLPTDANVETWCVTCDKHRPLYGWELRRTPPELMFSTYPGEKVEFWICQAELFWRTCQWWSQDYINYRWQQMDTLDSLTPVNRAKQYRPAAAWQLRLCAKDDAVRGRSNSELRDLLDVADSQGAVEIFRDLVGHTIPLHALHMAPKVLDYLPELQESVVAIVRKLSEHPIMYATHKHANVLVQRAMELPPNAAYDDQIRSMAEALFADAKELCFDAKGEGCVNAAIRRFRVASVEHCTPRLAGSFRQLAASAQHGYTVKNLIMQCVLDDRAKVQGSAEHAVAESLVRQLQEAGILNIYSGRALDIAEKARWLQRTLN